MLKFGVEQGNSTKLQQRVGKSINFGCKLTEEISQYREGPDTQTTEGGGRGDVSVQFMDHGLLTVTTHHHLLVFQLLSNLVKQKKGQNLETIGYFTRNLATELNSIQQNMTYSMVKLMQRLNFNDLNFF